MYAMAIKREQKKMQKQIAKRKPREVASSDSKSDSDISLHCLLCSSHILLLKGITN
jgi:hypothetical protein